MRVAATLLPTPGTSDSATMILTQAAGTHPRDVAIFCRCWPPSLLRRATLLRRTALVRVG